MEIAPDLEIVAIVHDGLSALQAVDSYAPDVLILEANLPLLDGIGVLEALSGRNHRPKIMVCTSLAREPFVAKVVALGANYCIMKPFDLPTLLRRLRQLGGSQDTPQGIHQEKRQNHIEYEATRYITALGVPSHFKGYLYLKEAITMVVQDSTLLDRVTKGLYPDIAKRYHTSSEQVERAIRHAIEATWTRGNLQAIHQIFAYSVNRNRGKPTNSSFIARLADQVRMQVRTGS